MQGEWIFTNSVSINAVIEHYYRSNSKRSLCGRMTKPLPNLKLISSDAVTCKICKGMIERECKEAHKRNLGRIYVGKL